MRFNPLLDRLDTYPQLVLEQRKERVRRTGLTLYDFSVGDPVEATPAFIRKAIEAAIPEVSGYPGVRGTPELRNAIAGYLRRRFGVDLDPDTQLLPTSGSKEAVFHMPLLVVDPFAPDRGVVMPDPGYPAYRRGTLFAGGEPVPQPLDGDFRQRPWEIPADTLARCRMVWLNSPHNPSGATLERDELHRAWELCRAHDLLLVNDECYADIHDGDPPHSLLEIATQGVLVLHSLSKRSGMTGYRSGFVAGDPQLIDRLVQLRSNPGLAASDLVNAAATAAWSDDDHVVGRRAVFSEKRRLLLGFLEGEGIEVVASRATFYLWLRCPPALDDTTYADALLERGIVVSPGRLFGWTGAGAGYVRVALVPGLDECRESLGPWAQAHRDLDRSCQWRS